ncbi:SIS domain-containing protein [Streptomyces sp. NPDC020983]|uniref:SIS domain-containing protein n=1 Tax=Streptomyces sp. NPDC020983 TaxID=3365106 RepID=UPI0037BAFCD7
MTMLNDADGRSPSAAAEAAAAVKGYVDDLTLALAQIEVAAMADVVECLVSALRDGRRVLVAGNGGSSTAALHIASDLAAAGQGFGPERQAVALTENIARVTAIANDYSYDEIFSRQLPSWARPGDVLLLLSVSGRSPNLVRAAVTGRELGMTVLAALGAPGDVAALAHRHVVLGQADYGLTEDLHVSLGHMAVRVLGGGAACRVPAAGGAGGG